MLKLGLAGRLAVVGASELGLFLLELSSCLFSCCSIGGRHRECVESRQEAVMGGCKSPNRPAIKVYRGIYTWPANLELDNSRRSIASRLLEGGYNPVMTGP